MRSRCLTAATSVLLAASLLASACSDSDHSSLGNGSLGTVTVRPGDSIQIRSISSFDPSGPGEKDYLRAVELAVEDYGPIHGGFSFEVGEGIDDPCSADSGPSMAGAALADASTVGVIGPSCSATATTAVPLITAGGLVVISMSNTSPLLTSDLAGTPSEHYQPGYYRTAHNDLYQGEAVSAFLHDEFGPLNVAVVHEGDAYTQGLAEAFRSAFERRGGMITDFIKIELGATDLSEVLDQIAAGQPDAVFMPLLANPTAELLEVLREHEAFDDTVLVSGDAALHHSLLELPTTEGIFIAGPDRDYGDNINQATGVDAKQAAERFEAKAGTPPFRAFWAHAYDATTLLLDAVNAASHLERGKLVIDRAGIRDYLDQAAGYQGIIGTISCDLFGDCGPSKITIIEHRDSDNPESAWENVVYRFTPQSPPTGR
ncbi:branched-chain amino acid ABC transporter substrate-binding protein [Candidatus Poriferisocius sp.]|uniref:branched-chain amino acid ABC transporter substrate-binding protein n=1 Tax=Candidatus Poriferisocius sp. TaxID=3101276 RepID=UPI003B01D9C8